MLSSRRTPSCLSVVEWGALGLSDDASGAEGTFAEVSAIPAGMRRRLGPFERAIVRAVLGLAPTGTAAKVTLGSRHGNLASAASILHSLAQAEPPSPTLFSHSVLNAGCGVANQVRKDRSSHTAVTAGPRTLHGALTEAWLQTEAMDQAARIIVLADAPFPTIYEALKTDWRADICIGLRVERAEAPAQSGQTALGNDGYLSLLNALRSGCRTLTCTNGNWFAAP